MIKAEAGIIYWGDKIVHGTTQMYVVWALVRFKIIFNSISVCGCTNWVGQGSYFFKDLQNIATVHMLVCIIFGGHFILAWF